MPIRGYTVRSYSYEYWAGFIHFLRVIVLYSYEYSSDTRTRSTRSTRTNTLFIGGS